LRQKKIEDCDSDFSAAFNAFTENFGGLTWGKTRFGQDSHELLQFLLEMASRPSAEGRHKAKDMQTLQEKFLSRFDRDQRTYAAEMLDLARASYRSRDDDNTYLGKIEGQWLATLEEGRRRIGKRCKMKTASLEAEQVIKALRDETETPTACVLPEAGLIEGEFKIKARQLVGQPAGPGIAFGTARVVQDPSDLFQFKTGEVLVCDAVDPNMTFVVPLAAGVVERRGGMLIHGAIIAREYGIPCVNGVADAVKSIRTGDRVTVDGHLGIVIIAEPSLKGAEGA
jgi:pyruvate,water dikinase